MNKETLKNKKNNQVQNEILLKMNFKNMFICEPAIKS